VCCSSCWMVCVRHMWIWLAVFMHQPLSSHQANFSVLSMVAHSRRISGQTALQLAYRGVYGVCWQVLVHSIDVCLEADRVLLFVDHVCQWMDHLMDASCPEILVLYTRDIDHDAIPVLGLGMGWLLPSTQHFVCQNGFTLTWEGNLHLVPSFLVTCLVGWFVG
jgi:hypothetical protein